MAAAASTTSWGPKPDWGFHIHQSICISSDAGLCSYLPVRGPIMIDLGPRPKNLDREGGISPADPQEPSGRNQHLIGRSARKSPSPHPQTPKKPQTPGLHRSNHEQRAWRACLSGGDLEASELRVSGSGCSGLRPQFHDLGFCESSEIQDDSGSTIL